MANVSLLLLVATCLFGTAGCKSKESSFEHQRVAAVEFRFTGPTWAGEQKLRNYIVLREGRPYSTADINNDIIALYESGFVDDVRVLAESTRAGVRVVYEVRARPGLGVPSKLIVGNAAFTDEELETELIGIDPYHSSPAAIESARQRLVERYRKSGYPDCVVSAIARSGGPAKPNDFLFRIVEGKRR